MGRILQWGFANHSFAVRIDDKRLRMPMQREMTSRQGGLQTDVCSRLSRRWRWPADHKSVGAHDLADADSVDP